MELSDGLLLQVSSGEQWCSRWKHPVEESDRSTSPSVLRSVASSWKDGLLNRKRPFVGRCCYSCTPQSWEQLFNPSIPSLGLRNVIYINETHTRNSNTSYIYSASTKLLSASTTPPSRF